MSLNPHVLFETEMNYLEYTIFYTIMMFYNNWLLVSFHKHHDFKSELNKYCELWSLDLSILKITNRSSIFRCIVHSLISLKTSSYLCINVFKLLTNKTHFLSRYLINDFYNWCWSMICDQPSLQFSCNFPVFNVYKNPFPDIYTLQQQVSSAVWQPSKVAPYFTSLLLYFSGPLGSLSPVLLSVKNRVPLKPVLGHVRDVALFHYPPRTDSIKPNLQFSCNFAVVNASKGSLFPIY
jgi:hypothetical protein